MNHTVLLPTNQKLGSLHKIYKISSECLHITFRLNMECNFAFCLQVFTIQDFFGLATYQKLYSLSASFYNSKILEINTAILFGIKMPYNSKFCRNQELYQNRENYWNQPITNVESCQALLQLNSFTPPPPGKKLLTLPQISSDWWNKNYPYGLNKGAHWKFCMDSRAKQNTPKDEKSSLINPNKLSSLISKNKTKFY